MKHTIWIIIAGLLSATHTLAALTMQQVAQYAYDAGFRGGSLVSAIAAADAESARDPDAVANNVVIVDAAGNIIPGTNGQPQIDIIPTTGKVMLPLNSIHNMSGGRRGKVTSHCRGLWQFNNSIFPLKPTDAQAFSPSQAAACAWIITRHGRDWGKWRVMRNGQAYIESRLFNARVAAAAVDSSVITSTAQRVQGRVTAGFIRKDPAGTVLRRFHRGDTGQLTAGPVLTQIKQGPQTSWKLWWRATWDTGEVGWVSEDLLMASTLLTPQNASPVSEPNPANAYHIPRRPTLAWTIGANTITHRVYLSTDPALPPSSLKWEGRSDTWTATADLPWRTRHWWRVDSLGRNGLWVPGPVSTFCTVMPPVDYLAVQSLNVTPANNQPGCRLQINGTAVCSGQQPVIIGASITKGAVTHNDTPHDVTAVIQGTTAFSRVFDIPWSATAGVWTVRVALWQDGDANGTLGSADRVLAEMSRTVYITDPLPKVMPVVVNPVQMAPGAQATITAQVFAVPGTNVVTARLFRAESQTYPDPSSWTLINTRTLNPVITNSGGTVTFTDQPPTIRRYWYAINATDNLNRTGPIGVTMFQPDDVIVTIGDRTPPVINWTYPTTDGLVINAGNQPTGTATDNDRIERFEYSYNGEAWQAISLSGNNWFLSYSGGATSTGSHRLTLRATDRSGNVTTSTRLYYIPPSGNNNLDFDETLDFTGDTAPFWWSRSFQEPDPSTAGFSAGRMHATGDGATATLDANKRLTDPATFAVEASFLTGPEGATLNWNRLFFNDLTVRILRPSTSQWQLQTGDSNNPQTTPLVIPGNIEPQSITVFIVISDGRFYVRAGRAAWPYEVFAQSTILNSQFSPGSLGSCRFILTGNSRGPAWLDNITFRELRQPTDVFAPRSTGFTGGATPRFNLEWMSFPGRSYVVELNDTGTWRTHNATFPATGLVTTTNAAGPVPGVSKAQARIRQVIP